MSRNQRTQKSLSARAFSRLAEIVMTGTSWVSVFALWGIAASVYVSPATSRLAGAVGILFPAALFATVASFVACLFVARSRSWISLFGLICASGSIRSYCPVHVMQDDVSDSALTVMSYNCFGFSAAKTNAGQDSILQYVVSQGTDIFCYQEGVQSFEHWNRQVPAFAERFPYVSQPFPAQSTAQGCCSRWPIVRTELVTSHTQNAVVAFWIARGKGDSLLVLNCHLQSNNLTLEDRSQYSQMVHRPQQQQSTDSTLHASRTLASKFAAASGIRALMADTVVQYLERHPGVPTIVCGDFNDTPISYSAYRMQRAGLTDAYRAAGSGIGRSFNKDAMYVRIDHQFCSKSLRPVRARIDCTPKWSDHYPIVVTYNGW